MTFRLLVSFEISSHRGRHVYIYLAVAVGQCARSQVRCCAPVGCTNSNFVGGSSVGASAG